MVRCMGRCAHAIELRADRRRVALNDRRQLFDRRHSAQSRGGAELLDLGLYDVVRVCSIAARRVRDGSRCRTCGAYRLHSIHTTIEDES